MFVCNSVFALTLYRFSTGFVVSTSFKLVKALFSASSNRNSVLFLKWFVSGSAINEYFGINTKVTHESQKILDLFYIRRLWEILICLGLSYRWLYLTVFYNVTEKFALESYTLTIWMLILPRLQLKHIQILYFRVISWFEFQIRLLHLNRSVLSFEYIIFRVHFYDFRRHTGIIVHTPCTRTSFTVSRKSDPISSLWFNKLLGTTCGRISYVFPSTSNCASKKLMILCVFFSTPRNGVDLITSLVCLNRYTDPREWLWYHSPHR